MGLFSRSRNTQTKYELVRRQQQIDEITAIAREAHYAIGNVHRAGMQDIHDTLLKAQKLLDKAGPHLSAERRQALYFRLMSYSYEVADLTNQACCHLSARFRR